MSIENSTEYQEALHFCMNNIPEVVARNMARDMIRVAELEACLRSIKDDRAVWTGLSGLNGEQRATINQLLR